MKSFIPGQLIYHCDDPGNFCIVIEATPDTKSRDGSWRVTILSACTGYLPSGPISIRLFPRYWKALEPNR